MNKKCLVYSGLMIVLMASQPSFSMGKKLVLRGAKLVGAGTGICAGLFALYKKSDSESKLEKYFSSSDRVSVPTAIEKLARAKMEELKVPNAKSIPIGIAKDMHSWGVFKDKALFVGLGAANELNEALHKPLIIEQYNELLQMRLQMRSKHENKKTFADRHSEALIEDLHRSIIELLNEHITNLKKCIDKSDQIVDANKMLVGHEAGHMFGQDAKRKKYALVAIPIGVQTLSTATSSIFNKIFGIKDPKTWVQTLLRSSGAVASIAPKWCLTGLGMIVYRRHLETQADEFACKHAQSLKELEAYRDFWKQEEDQLKQTVPAVPGQSEKNRMLQLRIAHFAYDHEHPYLGDRVEHVQRHIDEWNKNHKVE